MANARRVGAVWTVACAVALTCGQGRAVAQGLPGLGGGGFGAGGLGLPAAAAPIAAPIGGPIGGAATSALTGAVAPQKTIWGFFGLSKDNLAACHTSLEQCRAKICATPLGQVLNGATLPFGAATGGLLPPICPPSPTATQLAQEVAAGGAQGVAATIKAEEAKAKAKIAALSYLATVDCGVWPEAEKAMIDALRLDRNECVRFAAARCLATGCCCTEKTAAALTKVLDGSTEDGGILERSERVKSAAVVALNHCVDRYIPRAKKRPESPAPPVRPEMPSAAVPADALPGDAQLAAFLNAYYDTQANRPGDVLLAEARAALGRAGSVALGVRTLPTGSRSVYHALVKANHASHAAAPPSPGDAAPPPPVIALDHDVSRAGADDPRAAEPPPIPTTIPDADPVPPPPAIPGVIPDPNAPQPPPPAAAEAPLPPLPPLPRAADAPVPTAPRAARPRTPTPTPTGQRSLLQILASSRRPRGV